MELAAISDRVGLDHLDIFGALHPEEGGTIILLGPKEPGFWAHFTASAEYQDGQRDPIDRWSMRVISQIANEIGAEPRFPFAGPPYHPFIAWAKATGRTWDSPAGMLVHDVAGLFVSFRGALRLRRKLAFPPAATKPCDNCLAQPCLSACPVGALGRDGYDVNACHGYLGTPAGLDCMSNGCKARRACPVSQSYGRLAEQSSHHMRYFHK